MNSPAPFFDTTQRSSIDPHRIPRHVALIPDGNRRWAQKQLLEPTEGHRQGADVLLDIVKAARDLQIEVLSFYGFSTENWRRPPEEVKATLCLIESYLEMRCEEMIAQGIRLQVIGNRDLLPTSLVDVLQSVSRATADCKEIQLLLALNYGGRDELCRMVKKIALDCVEGRFSPFEIEEELLSQRLDTAGIPDPELLIRTSGEQRVSNFLLWQLSYAELYFVEKFWPAFTPQDLLEAVLWFQQRQKRWGT